MYLVKYIGAINHTVKGEYNSMIVTAIIKVFNKKTGTYVARDGSEKESRKVGYGQNDDDIIGEISVRKEAFDVIEKGKEYELIGEYVTSKGGNYITWKTARPIFNNGKATA